MRKIEGDLMEMAKAGDFDVIVHGANCFHEMSGGIAKVIARAFPEALEADRQTGKGDRGKLGTITWAEVERGGHSFAVVNAYTQQDYRGGGRLVDYDAVEDAFAAVARQFPGARIGYPMIGAGMAGGDWDKIAPRIDAALHDHDHALVVLPGTRS